MFLPKFRINKLRTIVAMNRPFAYLFDLPDGVVHTKVLSMLSLVDIARLDSAVANKDARAVFYRWCHHIAKDIEIDPKKSSSFLYWLRARGIKTNKVAFNDTDGECKQGYFENAHIRAKEASISAFGNTFVAFTDSLRGLYSMDAYSAWNYKDTTVMHKLFEHNPKIRSFVPFSWLVDIRQCPEHFSDHGSLLQEHSYTGAGL